MMDFSLFAKAIKESFSKEELEIFESIEELESVQLAEFGSNDIEGYQIFTPQFIVKQMAKAVGDDCVDFSKTILEPTSGDGAFTTYLVQKRLEKAARMEYFHLETLRALSTIYSIEMDKNLIQKQRNNIYTLVKHFCEGRHIAVDECFLNLVKCIITTNFMWAMFNADFPNGGLFVEVAYKMPDAERGKFKSLEMPVWHIAEKDISLSYEGVDVW